MGNGGEGSIPYNTISSFTNHILNFVLIADVEGNLPRGCVVAAASRHLFGSFFLGFRKVNLGRERTTK
jgi:hypothetical protein